MRQQATFDAILFDWDGTLVDSAAATFQCYRKLFAAHGVPFDRTTFERTYSPDWYQTYRAVGLPEERWRAADEHWLELYAQQRATALPGALAAVQRLEAEGLSLGLVTSGDRRRVEHESATLGFAPHISVLVCAGEAARPKPAPDPLLSALGQLGVAAQRAAYVGDSPEDVQMARSAGVYAVGIPGGFPNRGALLASQPDFLADMLATAVDHLLTHEKAP